MLHFPIQAFVHGHSPAADQMRYDGERQMMGKFSGGIEMRLVYEALHQRLRFSLNQGSHFTHRVKAYIPVGLSQTAGA